MQTAGYDAHQEFASTAVPDYGIDAPGVMRFFFAVACGLLAAAYGAAHFLSDPWTWLAVPLSLGALVTCGLGTSMLAYSMKGKQALRDHLLRQRTWRGDEFTLDLGAGSGLMAIGAALRSASGMTVALDIWNANDLSRNSEKTLRRNADIERVGHRLHVETCDVRQLNFPDASVDCVVSVFCIHNIEPASDRLLVCNEIARVLKPGGTAMIADFPNADAYAEAFRSAGLVVDGPYRSYVIALGISGYLVARKTE